MRFTNVDANGSVATGLITMTAEDRIQLDWHATDLSGDSTRYLVTMTRIDDERTQFVVSTTGNEPMTMVDFVYERVDEAPDPFAPRD